MMLRGYGYNRVKLDGRTVEEHDTFQCAHCNTTVFVKPAEPSPWCACCDRQWCGQPQCRECTPFMKKIEAAEARDRQRRLLWQEADNT
jgi:hypothetical protein